MTRKEIAYDRYWEVIDIFNKEVIDAYIASLNTVLIALLYIAIEIFFGGEENPKMQVLF